MNLTLMALVVTPGRRLTALWGLGTGIHTYTPTDESPRGTRATSTQNTSKPQGGNSQVGYFDPMLLMTANPFTGLVFDFEDPNSSYTSPDIAEFVRLDKAIYGGEIC